MTQFGTSGGSNNNSPNAKVEDNEVLERKLFAWTRVIVTVIVLVASLYVILSQKFSDDSSKWAFGMIGLILGYWFR